MNGPKVKLAGTVWKLWNDHLDHLVNPCMKFNFFFGKKTAFEALGKWHILKISITCPRVRQIQDLGQAKYKHFKHSFQFGFLWIPSKPGKQNWKVPFLLIFIIVKNQCEYNTVNCALRSTIILHIFSRVKVFPLERLKELTSLHSFAV